MKNSWKLSVIMVTVMNVIFEDIKYLASCKTDGNNCNIKNSALRKIREMLHSINTKEGIVEHEKTVVSITVCLDNYSKIARELFLIVDESKDLSENLKLVKSRDELEGMSGELNFVLTGDSAVELLKFKKKYSE